MSAATPRLLPAGWTQAQFDALRRMWDDGEKTIVIAIELGMTQGQVTGVIERHREIFGNRDRRARAKRRGKVLAALWLQRRDAIIAGCAA
jgi:hypothetical protein